MQGSRSRNRLDILEDEGEGQRGRSKRRTRGRKGCCLWCGRLWPMFGIYFGNYAKLLKGFEQGCILNGSLWLQYDNRLVSGRLFKRLLQYFCDRLGIESNVLGGETWSGLGCVLR